ncbi:MAG TPA: hypothetical protein VF183_02075 [Acidimicrobiales bacterium]
MPSGVPLEPAPPSQRMALRCEHCDVLWRGQPDEPCWSCGCCRGVPAAAVIVVAP